MSWFSLRRVTQGLLSVAPALACLLLNAAQGATLDSSFNPTINGTVSSIAVQSDGRIVIGGSFNAVGGVALNNLARLNADGSLDQTFPQTSPAQAVYSVKVAGNHIFVGAGDGISRYSLDGQLEWTYALSVKAFTVDAENRVVFGGQFSRVESQPHRNIARLNANGTLDTTFNAQLGCCAGEGVYALAIRGTDILAGGAFQSVNNAAASHLTLLDPAGSLVSGFTGTASPSVLALVPAADGKFIRVSERAVVRHLANGSTDHTFTPFNLGTDDRLTAAALHPDGTTIVGGFGKAVRLNGNGAVDTSFNLQADGAVYSVAVDNDGFLLVGGTFTGVNGIPQSGIARFALTAPTAGAPRLTVAAANGQLSVSWAAVAGSYVLQSRTLDSATWSDVSGAATVVNGRNTVEESANGAGKIYRLRQ